MREDVRLGVLRRLKADFKFKESAAWLQQGTCPKCGKREVFTSAETPWTLKCGRENKCGWSATTKELYPDEFGKFNERFPATTTDPNATADAYMDFVRGFSASKIKGWYRQGHYSHPRGDRSTATVVFDLDREAGIWMERLVETVRVKEDDGTTSERKANFVGGYKGLWWQPPGLAVKAGDELWLVEGCLDAIALNLNGIPAVSILACNNYPARMLDALTSKDVTLVWALDNDAAGKKYIKKHIEAAHQDGFENRCALIPQNGRDKVDWNDCHLAGDLEKKDIERYRFHGDLHLARNATDKGLLIWQRYGSRAFAVKHDTRTYWFEIPDEIYAANLRLIEEDPSSNPDPEVPKEIAAARKSAKVYVLANCDIEFLYFQQNKLTDESWYYTRIKFPHGRHVIKNTFTGGQVAAGAEFKKRLLSIAPGALFSGSTSQLNWLVSHYLDDIKIVETVPFIGYSKEYKTWIFPQLAVSAGKVYQRNDEDFFEVGNLSIKSLNQSLHLHIGDLQEYRPEWVNDVHTAFGAGGLITLVWWFGSLFAEQIREVHKSYPFLEVVGEAGAGKSTLIEALWKLVGRTDYEGFDPNKSTNAARARNMTQVANLPVSLIESDREDSAKTRQFDWDELKTAYNGRASRATGVNNGGNETVEPPFRGSILISQNAAVSASEAIMQRIVHVRFDTAGHTARTRSAADALASVPVEQVSHFLIMATRSEAMVMETIRRETPKFEAELMKMPEIRHQRIGKNHGQLMALAVALARLIDLPQAWLEELLQALRMAAIERQYAIAADHPMIEEFWEMIDFLGEARTNHSKNPEYFAINLNHLQRVAAMNNQPLPPLQDLKKHLKTSRSRKFIGTRAVSSAIESDNGQSRTVKCWIFERGK